MDECFIIGRVVSKPTFKFFYKGNDISICYFKIQESENTIHICAFNNLADFVYREVKEGQLLFVYGRACGLNKSKIYVRIKTYKIL